VHVGDAGWKQPLWDLVATRFPDASSARWQVRLCQTVPHPDREEGRCYAPSLVGAAAEAVPIAAEQSRGRSRFAAQKRDRALRRARRRLARPLGDDPPDDAREDTA